MEPTTIKIKHGRGEIEVTLPWDATSDDMVETIYGMLITLGYHPESVKDSIRELLC